METQINCSDNENSCEIDCDEDDEEEDDDEDDDDDDEDEDTDLYEEGDEEDDDEDEDDEEEEEEDEDEEDEPTEDAENIDDPEGNNNDEELDRVLNSKYKKTNFKIKPVSSSSSSKSSSTSSLTIPISNADLTKRELKPTRNEEVNSETESSSSMASLEWNEQKLKQQQQQQTRKPSESESTSETLKQVDLKNGDTNCDETKLNQLNLNKICSNGQTFLWDLLVSDSLNDEPLLNELDKSDTETTAEISSTSSTSSVASSSLSTKFRNLSPVQHQKIIKEAEKQLQTLLCLPSTDKRIRVKFIESCLLNLKSNRACVFSLRLLTKLFSSFQQYSATSAQQSALKTSISDLNLSKSPLTTVSVMQEQLLYSSFHSKHLNSSTSAATNSMPSNITEVHRIVSLTEYNYAMMSTFFESLKAYTSEQSARLDADNLLKEYQLVKSKRSSSTCLTEPNVDSLEHYKQKLMSLVRLNIQARLQFLSFVYSTLGSPRDFELTRTHVEILWDSLIRFNDLNHNNNSSKCLSIRDDLFNWFSSQAKNKDQHAVNIDTFKFIFINKMPYLDPNNFSQTALHLYQELFKIYKYSYNQLQQIDQTESLTNNQIESSAIDYIWKLAFRSSNKDVSLAAIQFLNSHYIQADNLDNETQFIERCMCYLMNEAYANLIKKKDSDDVEANLAVIERGLLLIKNHLDSFQRRNAYELRVLQFKEQTHDDVDLLNKFISHAKLLKQIRFTTEATQVFKHLNEFQSINAATKSAQLNTQLVTHNAHQAHVNLVCQMHPSQIKFINQSQFKFTLRISTSETVGDLRAVIREILLRIIRTHKLNTTSNSSETDLESLNQTSQFSFVNNSLIGSVCTNLAILTPANSEIFKSMLENEDDLYIKISSNGQDAIANASSTLIVDSKLISDIGFKDMQLVYLNILNRTSNQLTNNNNNNNKITKLLDKNRIPMILLSNELNFSNLFDLLNLISRIELEYDLTQRHRRVEFLSTKLWEVITLLPTNQTYSKLISFKLETHLSKLADQFRLNDSCSTYKLLYYLQIIEIVYKQQEVNSLSSNWSINLYRLLVNISKNLVLNNMNMSNSTNRTNLNSVILLECLLITLRLMSSFLLEQQHLVEDDDDDPENEAGENGETPRKKIKRLNQSHSSKSESDSKCRSFIKWSLFKDLIKTNDDIDMFLNILFDIQIFVCTFNPDMSCAEFNFNIGEIKIELLSYTMQFLAVCLVGSESVEAEEQKDEDYSLQISMLKDVFFSDNLKQSRTNWLKSLFLIETPNKRINIHLRKDTCNWLYKICVLEQQNNLNSLNCAHRRPSLLKLILNEMLSMLDTPVKYKLPVRTESLKFNCKDYFILMSNLICNLDTNTSNSDLIDMNELMLYLARELKERQCLEYTQSGVCYEDDVLIGLLSIALAILKQQHQLISSKKLVSSNVSLVTKPCHAFIDELFDYLFKITNNTNKKAQLSKCRSSHSRSLCFDVLAEVCRSNLSNYDYLSKKLIDLHKTLTITQQQTHLLKEQAYKWDYWPRDDSRSSCGYVGLINLGATCYMATSMQQLYMISEVRECILRSPIKSIEYDKSLDAAKLKNLQSYDKMLGELKRMFAYLQESERKAYNPKEFCKVYIMDSQPLNTAEQKDMQEFFTDLISKLEETSNTELKFLIKSLFGGTITNLVVSLDCPHVSCTLEEFYTVRCQVAGMKDLYDSLNEITVKDTLEGDNMYTCSKCARKVRAEKRACFQQLPQILCFNTMRYTFNMITMLKEKVNTHFSFPLQLNMSGYMEKNLKASLPDNCEIESNRTTSESEEGQQQENIDEDYLYELIGVTVHTGTAEGGHYYSFIRERNLINEHEQDDVDSLNKAKWYLFNDAEVKPFDAASQLASECFGGETTSKTYDSTSDKFMDLSFEKTNSAYMLFYERKSKRNLKSRELPTKLTNSELDHDDLIKSIWQDNVKFMNDKQILEHTYFNFVWQMCDQIPRLAPPANKDEIESTNESLFLAAKLGVSFLLETYVHARDKPNMLQWIDLLTKLFYSSRDACKWLISHLTCGGLHLCVKIFFKCPNSSIRNMFQRLFLHVINRFLKEDSDKQLVEKFIQNFLNLIDLNNKKANKKSSSEFKPNIRFMSEYFTFLTEFARSSTEQCLMLIHAGAIQKCAEFYLTNRRAPNKKQDLVSSKVMKSVRKKPLKKKRKLLKLKKTDNSDTESINSVGSASSLVMSTSASSAASSSASTASSNTSLLSSFMSSSSSETSSLSCDDEEEEEDDDEDVIPIHDQKSKLKVFEKIIALIAYLVDVSASQQHAMHHSDEKLSFRNHKLNMNFFYKSILDDININNVRNILVSLVRVNACRCSHLQDESLGEKKKQKNNLFAVKFVDMCCKSIRRLQTRSDPRSSLATSDQDRSIPFWHMLGNYSCGLLEIDSAASLEENKSNESDSCAQCVKCKDLNVNFTEIIISKLKFIIDSTPCNALQWLSSVASFNKPIQEWLLENMSYWVKPLLVAHKQTNVRFSAANLLVNLIPNRVFRESFNTNRNILVPFKLSAVAAQVPSVVHRSNELNSDFDSVECKTTLHRVITYLFSLVDQLEPYVQTEKLVKETSTTADASTNSTSSGGGGAKLTMSTSTNHLVQYFTVLIYFMCGKEEKKLFSSFNQTIDKFWSLVYYPHIANNHVFTNLNKQVAVHFFYHTLVNCPENVAHILATSELKCEEANSKETPLASTSGSLCSESNTTRKESSKSSSSRFTFTNRMARELPMCTVAVDHEDGDLITYNRQCLHPYYASIRLLCQHSPLYTREMSTHSNFYWAFKHIMPYSSLYANAVQELNKCVQLFLHQAPLAGSCLDDNESSSSSSDSSASSSSESAPSKKDEEENDEEEEDEEDDDEEEDTESDELQRIKLHFKETLATNFLMNPDIDPKQSWQSIIMIMKSIIETIEDGTLVLTRRGLSVLSLCFFHITLIHNSNNNNINETSSTSSSSSSSSSLSSLTSTSLNSNLNYELCECMQILMQLCETVKHHLDKRTDGIRQILTVWKERTDVLKRACMLVNFHNTSDVRNNAMNLIKMILAISPGTDSLQYVIQIVYASFCASNNSQTLMSFTQSSCAHHHATASSSTTATSSASSVSSSLSSKYSQCVLTPQLIGQAAQLMGHYFPLSKKLTQSQQVAANAAAAAAVVAGTVRVQKNLFNMFLPLQFVTHTHINGGITVFNQLQQQQQQQQQQPQNSLDYQKALMDSYAPFATFFDWICRYVFSRRLVSTSSTTATSSSTSSTDSTPSSSVSLLQTTKQLIDLILFISQQTLLMNVSFVAHLNEYLQENSTTTATTTTTTNTTNIFQANNFDSSLLNPTGLEFYNLIVDSAYFHSFVSAVLVDYRYLLNKKEIYEFMQLFLRYYILNPSSNTSKLNKQQQASSSSTQTRSTTPTSVLLNLKSLIEISCKTVNEIRFYFEFQQLCKHLSTSAAAAAAVVNSSSSTQALANLPNITHNLDFKSSQMLGSIKLIYLLVPSIATASTANEEMFNLIKFKLELRNFLVEIAEYLRLQLVEMNSFILCYSSSEAAASLVANVAKVVSSESQQTGEHDDLPPKDIKQKRTDLTMKKSKKAKLEESSQQVDSKSADENEELEEEEEEQVEENKKEQNSEKNETSIQLNSALVLTILRPVDLKRKCLDHILQVLTQTLNYITSSLSISSSSSSESSANNTSKNESNTTTSKETDLIGSSSASSTMSSTQDQLEEEINSEDNLSLSKKTNSNDRK